MSNATFTPITLSDAQGYRLELDIAPRDGRATEGLVYQNITATLQCYPQGGTTGALQRLELVGSRLSVEVAERDVTSIGTHHLRVEYDLKSEVQASRKEHVVIEEQVFIAVRAERAIGQYAIPSERAVTLIPIASQAPNAGTTATAEKVTASRAEAFAVSLKDGEYQITGFRDEQGWARGDIELKDIKKFRNYFKIKTYWGYTKKDGEFHKFTETERNALRFAIAELDVYLLKKYAGEIEQRINKLEALEARLAKLEEKATENVATLAGLNSLVRTMIVSLGLNNDGTKSKEITGNIEI